MARIYLQLFASKNAGSQTTSYSEGHSSEEGGSSYSKQGGSHSETNTVGQSITNAESHSKTHTEGNSSSISTGKTWASGAIDDKTQANFDRYNNDYVESDKVTAAYDALQQTLSQKPTFESAYADKLSELYDSIMNRDPFNYNFNEDAMYQMYKDQYTQAGKQAMEDTLGRAQAANGGYGSSYSQSAGQQTYQQYLQQLNDIIPTLRDQAYEMYRQEGQDMLNKYDITNQAYNQEYGQYRDSVADWQADRGFQYGLYSDERNFDYGQFQDNRNYWNQEYWNEKNAEQSNYQASNTWYQEDSQTDTYSRSQTDYWENSVTDTSYWETGSSNSWSNANSYTGNYSQTLALAQQAAGYTGGTVGNRGGNNNNSIVPTQDDTVKRAQQASGWLGNSQYNAMNNQGTFDGGNYAFNDYSGAGSRQNLPSDSPLLNNNSMMKILDAAGTGSDTAVAKVAKDYNLDKDEVAYLLRLLELSKNK